MTQAVIYARVSTDEQAKGQSITNQLEMCRRYCEEQGWTVALEISDSGHSGSGMNRPGIKRLAAVAPSIDYIVATAIDRLHRKKFEWALFQRDVLDPHGVKIATITGIRDQGDPNTWLADEMEQTFAEHYSRLISWKTVQGMRRLVEQGLWARTPPCGTRAGREKGIPERHPGEWPWLKKMFELASTGHSFGEIARYLNEHGSRARNGNEWATSTITQVIRNPFYIGEIHLKDEVFPALHDCRIDAGIWEAAQKPVSSHKGGHPSDYVYLLPNVFTDHWVVTAPKNRAGEQVHLVGKWCNGRGGKRYHYYYRADKLRANGGLKAEPVDDLASTMRVSVSAPLLEEAVLRELIGNARGDGLVRDLKDVMRTSARECERERKELKRQLSRLEGEQNKLDGLLARAFAERETEVIGALNRQSAKLREQESALRRQLERAEGELETFAAARTRAEDRGRQVHLLEELWKRGKRKELKRLLALLVHSVLVRVDGVWLKLNPVCDTQHEATAAGFEPATFSSGG